MEHPHVGAWVCRSGPVDQCPGSHRGHLQFRSHVCSISSSCTFDPDFSGFRAGHAGFALHVSWESKPVLLESFVHFFSFCTFFFSPYPETHSDND